MSQMSGDLTLQAEREQALLREARDELPLAHLQSRLPELTAEIPVVERSIDRLGQGKRDAAFSYSNQHRVTPGAGPGPRGQHDSPRRRRTVDARASRLSVRRELYGGTGIRA